MNNFASILLYLDPGTGSLLIQFLVAAIFGIILFFRKIMMEIKILFYRLFNKKPEDKK
jgi:hypothetical protein